ncbi:MAG: anhydro-N-acetylmuramic acid kinase [Thiotrichales bacterium]|nr:anhydro-N-acetylmuramic acid kinase [Thiotrichales bacterium]MBT4573624.1 anhydro-N-acetylmuramic acid kinase [Thiotrichales bacterium]MBT6809895.1 anhydro-N-acetylmuramic acid kinase [Thiotrichales bacterium]MBT7314250.1 anhydro-N-acetylmuramic acid kinase [Thiotrichales bacterium]MBT7870743.1 anhydro-N-acetylmuramic acid kinase [Thiotrichales bacterium]
MNEYFIGLMSGTSLDAVDAVVVDFASFPPKLCATAEIAISPQLRDKILALTSKGDNEIERLGQLDCELGELFATAANRVMKLAELKSKDITAIGSHGQTIRHHPKLFSLQIGDPNRIAEQTGVTTVADFRRRDIAVGGEGAPLAPAYHHWLLGGELGAKSGVVVNIGGMANITLLPTQGAEIVGFDTGPGNVLMNSWAEQSLGELMDRDGAQARSGEVVEPLLSQLKEEEFFLKPPPKSTGRETFNNRWLQQQLVKYSTGDITLKDEDIAATLCELTASTIATAILTSAESNIAKSLWVCGGGAHNSYLLERLSFHLPEWKVSSSETVGMDPDWVEAIAFAWLARQTISRQSGNLPSVTGATKATILGAIFPSVEGTL